MRKHVYLLLFSLLTGWGVQAQTQKCDNIALGTNFEAVMPDGASFRSLDAIVKTGPSGGVMETPLAYAQSNSDFGTKAVYGVVDNPSAVNSDFMNIDEPMMIISGVGTFELLLSCEVSGLKPGSEYTVTVEGYLLNSAESGCAAALLKTPLLLFPENYSLEPAMWQQKFTYSKTTMIGTSTTFSLQISSGWDYDPCLVLGISKIEIKACLIPKVKSSEGREVCIGEQVRLELDRDYYATTYQWEKSPNGTANWTSVGGNFKTILDEINTETWYRCTVDGFVSEAFKVTAVSCCEMSPGASRKTIYHDNFGTFSGPNSYVDAWGTPRIAKGWQTTDMYYTIPLPNQPLDPLPGTPDDGYYVISTLRDNVMGGWMRGGISEDASGDPNGGVLVVNVAYDYTGEIYRHRIDNLRPDIDLYAEVSIANASAPASLPPDVEIRIETKEGVLLGSMRGTPDTPGWHKVAMPPFTTTETSVVLSVHSMNTSGWRNGVDLFMDDIIFRACLYPGSGCTDPKAWNYDPQIMESDNSSCLYSDEENTYNGQVAETPVDTVGTKALDDCRLDVNSPITNAYIVDVEINGKQLTAQWVIEQENGNRITYDAKYLVSRSGITLFYLSIICDELKSSNPGVTYTVSAVYDVELRSTGISLPEAETGNLVVYPNPFTDKLTVLVKGAKAADIALYSIEGSLLATYRNLNEVEIAASKLSAGVYVVRVTAGGKTESVTVVKK